ncbi:MAG: DUF481 domain-containing protein [Gemmataceae bacterium]
MRYGWLALVLWMILTKAVEAQTVFRDAEFKAATNDAPANFTDKGLFAPPPAWPPPASEKPPPLWSGGAEFGLNGTEGNTQVLKIRLGANVLRRTDGNIFSADLVYGLARQMGETAENKALFNVRDEVFFREGPWGWFAAGQVEYDEFRDFDFRVAGHTGLAYLFVRTNDTFLRGRFGAGASKELGREDSRWIPEGLVGFDLDHRINKRQRLIAAGDIYPDLGRLEQHRIRVRAAWECALNDNNSLILRIGIQDRYDSSPGLAKRNDLDYFTTLLYRF